MRLDTGCLLFLMSWYFLPAQSQFYMATLNENASLEVHEMEGDVPFMKKRNSEIRMMEGFPRAFSADPAFKNFRNLTLSDLDENGSDEIIAGINNRIYVMDSDSIWWSNAVKGIIRFPASVGDLDGNDILDIVVLSGYVGNEGGVYAFDRSGALLEGWPAMQTKNWMLSSAALADLDNDGYLEVICADREGNSGQVYAFRYDGTLAKGDWPVQLPNTPAVTPSVGDVDRDGFKEVVICSTQEIFLFDYMGKDFPSWPVRLEGTRFSYQSPILVDLDNDGSLEIIGAGHGDNPVFYALTANGSHVPSWPKQVPGGAWTFCPPTVVPASGGYHILAGRPIGTNVEDMLYGWDEMGNSLAHFPLMKAGGVEGIIAIANVDSDEDLEMVFPSNLLTADGRGFIHAYKFDGSGEIPGFPLLVRGWTFLNGACVGDVNGDGQADLAVLSYTEHPGHMEDTIFISVFELQIPFVKEHNLWTTYKGNNTRDGFAGAPISTSAQQSTSMDISLYPNPVNDKLYISSGFVHDCQLLIYDFTGKKVFTSGIRRGVQTVNISGLGAGLYFYSLRYNREVYSGKLVKI